MDRPTVLLVGSGERMKDALGVALERHHLMVESVGTENAMQAAFAAAPDLLVLIGDAARDGGRAVLARLAESPVTATVPVVLLTDEAGLDRRLSAFKHGVVAVVPRTASADGMARRIAEIARELPERSGEATGELGEATVDELVELFSQQLRTGILSVTSGAHDGASAQIVLRAGRPVTEAIEELVERLRPLVASGHPGPLRYEFHESTSARLTLLEGDESEPEDAALLRGRRILLVEQNPARADVLVQELRARGALVVVADGEGAGLERARTLDPEVVILDGSGVHGWALTTLRALRRDPRLRWASLLVVSAAELWPGRASAPDLARLAASIKPLVRADRELAERAQRESAFDTRLEVIGPSRTLRALTQTGLGLRVSASHPRARVEVDLAEGLVAGARAIGPNGKQIAEGPAALAALLAIASGRVRVERKDAPASANVMAPLDDALAAAAAERAPIRPSVPPPSGISEPPRPNEPAAPAGPERLIERLEELLERLQAVLPAAEAAAAHETEPDAAKRPSTPKTKAIPPPRAPLPRGRKATILLGSNAPVPERAPEDDEDLPEIEATAEPGLVPKPPSGAVPAVPPVGLPPTARLIAEARPEPGRGPPTPHVEVEPIRVVGERLPSDPPPAMPQPPSAAEPSVQVAPELRAPSGPAPGVEVAPADRLASRPMPSLAQTAAEPAATRWESVLDAPTVRRASSRGPVWFATAFLLTLAVGGGGAAAYLYGDRLGLPWPRRDGSEGGTEPVAARARDAGPRATATPPPASVAVAAAVTEVALAGEDTAAADAGGSPAVGAVAAADAGAETATEPADASEPAEAIENGEPADEGDDDEGAADDPAANEESEESLPEDGRGDPREQRIRHLLRLANFQRNRGNLQDAESNYLAVLDLDRDNARALAGLARLHMARGSNGQALRWARRLVAARPRNAANHVLLGDVLEANGNRRAAAASWRRALELSPGLRSAQQRLARGR